LTTPNWLLYQRTALGHWYPVFGPLSELGHGVLVYVIIVGFPLLLVVHGLRKVRSGDRRFWRVVHWAAAAWPLFIAISLPHLYARKSHEWWAAMAIVCPVGAVWAAYGVRQVVPFLRSPKRGHTDRA
jgi:hypothetical protein